MGNQKFGVGYSHLNFRCPPFCRHSSVTMSRPHGDAGPLPRQPLLTLGNDGHTAFQLLSSFVLFTKRLRLI